jgi:membrane-associated PAP2 superfamily phosphatase
MNKRGNQRPFITYCFERATLWFSIRMALVIGTILGIINHGQAIVTGHFTSDRLFSLLLTYCVPFSVSLFSQIQGKRQRDRFQAETSAAAMEAARDDRSDRT